MSELKPCPFCGGWAEIKWSSFFTCEAQVRCSKCGCRTMPSKSSDYQDAKLLAETLWNRRVGEHK